MLSGYLSWWYSKGLEDAYAQFMGTAARVSDFFSLPTLLKTWVAPWKNDVSTAQNAALSDQMKLWEQNLASRLIGFIVRSFVILAAALILLGYFLLGLVLLVLWLAGPLFSFVLLYLALVALR